MTPKMICLLNEKKCYSKCLSPPPPLPPRGKKKAIMKQGELPVFFNYSFKENACARRFMRPSFPMDQFRGLLRLSRGCPFLPVSLVRLGRLFEVRCSVLEKKELPVSAGCTAHWVLDSLPPPLPPLPQGHSKLITEGRRGGPGQV